jgi:hypothetical protein
MKAERCSYEELRRRLKEFQVPEDEIEHTFFVIGKKGAMVWPGRTVEGWEALVIKWPGYLLTAIRYEYLSYKPGLDIPEKHFIGQLRMGNCDVTNRGRRVRPSTGDGTIRVFRGGSPGSGKRA